MLLCFLWIFLHFEPVKTALTSQDTVETEHKNSSLVVISRGKKVCACISNISKFSATQLFLCKFKKKTAVNPLNAFKRGLLTSFPHHSHVKQQISTMLNFISRKIDIGQVFFSSTFKLQLEISIINKNGQLEPNSRETEWMETLQSESLGMHFLCFFLIEVILDEIQPYLFRHRSGVESQSGAQQPNGSLVKLLDN